LFLDDVIQKAHLEREIASRLGGVRTFIGAGAGTGRFSIPLARQGFHATHLDISQGMTDTARQLAQEAGVLDRMRFDRGRVGDLTHHEHGTFDLVICCDAPITYTYADHVRTIAELTRVAAQALEIRMPNESPKDLRRPSVQVAALAAHRDVLYFVIDDIYVGSIESRGSRPPKQRFPVQDNSPMPRTQTAY
jgi:SAM-dependent methyltransferase